MIDTDKCHGIPCSLIVPGRCRRNKGFGPSWVKVDEEREDKADHHQEGWEDSQQEAGGLVRLVSEQDRYVVNQGNIVGQDLGPTAGITVFSVNAGWRPRETVDVTAGIDNLLDRAYAEHLSRSGAMVAGFEQTTRVNEPGRTFWLKLAVRY